MKRIIPLFCALSCLLTACKKSSSGTSAPATYHISCSINGTPQTFNIDPKAKLVADGTQSFFSMTGSQDSTGSVSLSIDINKSGDFNNTIAVGTYSDTSSAYDSYLGYTVMSLSSTYQAGNMIVSSGSVTVVNHLKLIITSIDDTGINGTFSGDIFVIYLNLKKTITNGDFYVKL